MVKAKTQVKAVTKVKAKVTTPAVKTAARRADKSGALLNKEAKGVVKASLKVIEKISEK